MEWPNGRTGGPTKNHKGHPPGGKHFFKEASARKKINSFHFPHPQIINGRSLRTIYIYFKDSVSVLAFCLDTEYSHWVVHNVHTNQGSQCTLYYALASATSQYATGN